ncbi:DUF433 domain-containing protein [candidate division KSB1 bacterium]|nr:DUF433 domain-containing protein [candidate division KSB1 bacterium]
MNERIVIDPDIQQGKPVIRGTRVPVARIVGGLAGGMTIEEIIREYEVDKEDVFVALSYATELIDTEQFHPLPVAAA